MDRVSITNANNSKKRFVSKYGDDSDKDYKVSIRKKQEYWRYFKCK